LAEASTVPQDTITPSWTKIWISSRKILCRYAFRTMQDISFHNSIS